MASSNRGRVYRDRLWDTDGREWRGQLGGWVAAEEVAQLLAARAPVVVHGFSRAFRSLAAPEAMLFWAGARHHLHEPGGSGAYSDANGLTYAAQVWSRGDERLIGFIEFC